MESIYSKGKFTYKEKNLSVKKTSLCLCIITLYLFRKVKKKNVFLGGGIGGRVKKFSVFSVTLEWRLKNINFKCQ